MSKKKPNIYVLVKVLQNGFPIFEGHFPLWKNRNVSLSNRRKGQIYLPLFPLPHDISILKIKGLAASLTLNQSTKGFLVTGGNIAHLKATDHSEKIFNLKAGDYASFMLQNLRILIKVDPFSIVKIKPSAAKYRGSFFRIFITNAKEVRIILLSTIISLLFFSLAYAALSALAPPIPKQFMDLKESYTLPFIHHDSLRTGPEALQNRLNRALLAGQVISFYTALGQLAMGLSFHKDPLIFPTTISLFQEIYKQQEAEIHAKIKLQELALEQNRRLFQNQTIRIPAVYGESFDLKLTRMSDLISKMHESFFLSLALRRKVSIEFTEDPSYDWGQYKNTKEATQKASDAQIAKEMAKISVFNQRTNEEMMYYQAQLLGDKAKKAREQLYGVAAERSEAIANILIPSGSPYFSFLQPTEFESNEQELSMFDPKPHATNKEFEVAK